MYRDKATKELLLVDLVIYLKHLPGNQPAALEKVTEKAATMHKARLAYLANHFGTASTRKLFNAL